MERLYTIFSITFLFLGCISSAEDWDAFSGSKSLHVSQRSAEWAGPRQTLDMGVIKNEAGAKLRFAIKLHSGDVFQYSWTLKMVTSRDDVYIHLYEGLVTVEDDWTLVEADVDFPQFFDVTSVNLFLEGSPAEAEPLIDDVSLVVGEDTTTGGSWEDNANARIDQLRKSELTIFVNLPELEDTANVKVELIQQRHRFPFGTAVSGQLIRQCAENGKDDLYCSFASDNFNYVVLENAMKWASLEPSRGQLMYENADATLAWAAERGMRRRGHTLFWAVPHHQTPEWVEKLSGNDLVEAVKEHVDNTVAHFGGRLGV